MKRSSWVGVLAAGGLLVTGCSSGGTTAASSTSASISTSASMSASSSSASSSKSSTMSSASDSSASDSSASDSTEAPAAQLDSATETWFSTFCSSLGDVGQYASPDTAGQSLNQEQQTVVAAYTGISTEATKAAGVIQATPPPTIASGGEIATATATGFSDLADVYGRGAQTIAALTPSSEADLKAAIDAVETEAKAAAPSSMAALDPGVETAVKHLPACATVLGS